MKIMFVTSRLPFPPIKGNTRRSYNQIKCLSKRHKIVLLSLIESEHQLGWIPELEKYCSRVETVLLSKAKSYLNMVTALTSKKPFQCSYFKSHVMQKRIIEIIEEERPDLLHVQLVRMAQYFNETRTIPMVLDIVDALSLNLQRRMKRESLHMKPLVNIEWKRFKEYESVACGKFDKLIVSSKIDKEWMGLGDNCFLIPNGVDAGHFQLSPIAERKPHTLVFTGKMGYFPNVDAAVYFTKSVLPLIKERVPEVEFLIVGAEPSKKVRKLSRRNNGVSVTGFVENLREYLGSATVAVCPMRSGSGMQFKVLEAFAMGTPVVGSPQALAAFEITTGEHAFVANSAEEFAEQIILLLNDAQLRERLSRESRRLVEERYTWEATTASLERIYLDAVGDKPSR